MTPDWLQAPGMGQSSLLLQLQEGFGLDEFLLKFFKIFVLCLAIFAPIFGRAL